MNRAKGALLIGNELLLGKRQDKHLAHTIETLAERNLVLDFVHMLADDQAAIAKQLATTMADDAWVISFGGIGATPDDKTRQAAADAAGVPLVRHPQAVRLIEERFGADAYPQRIRMAELPEGCELIPNAYNQIPGFSIGHHHFVPGFPQMAWDMLDWLLEARYPDWRGEPRVQAIVRVLGARESALVPLQESLLARFPEIELSSLPHMDKTPTDSEAGSWVELGLRGPADQVREADEAMRQGLDELGRAYEVLKAPLRPEPLTASNSLKGHSCPPES